MAERFNSPNDAAILGKKLKSARILRNFTLTEVASKTGIHHSQISRIERGLAITAGKNVQKLCTFFDVRDLRSTPERRRTPAALSERARTLAERSASTAAALDSFLHVLENT
ncbi:helix-turn-helix domain-containing protein [Stenotrophomonas maltophilia]|uniref:helix-turn-helix domain-containing protein n=1 Tax=Stenotrophomonas maltophilia TaxID=40324 RepID=UPI003D04032C